MVQRTRDWLRKFIFLDAYIVACWKIQFIIAAKANAQLPQKSDTFFARIQQSFSPRDYTSLLKCFDGNETNIL